MFLKADGLADHHLAARQFRIGLAHLAHQRRHDLVDHRLLRAEQRRVAHGAAHDAAQHVAAALVGGQHAFGDEEAHRAQMVGNHAQARIGSVARVAGGLLRRRDQRAEQVDLIIVVGALHHRGDALEARAGVDRRLRQAGPRAVGDLLELHENEIPDLDEAVAVFLGRARRAAPVFIAVVVEDFRARAAGAGVAHLPEIGFCAEPHDAVVRQARDLLPERERLVVILVDGSGQLCRREAPLLGEQVPGELDRMLLEIVAEREIAEHLEEGVVARREADIVEIVVLAASAHAFLRGGGAEVVALFDAGEDVLELHHAGIGEHQRRIIARHQRRLFKTVTSGEIGLDAKAGKQPPRKLSGKRTA